MFAYVGRIHDLKDLKTDYKTIDTLLQALRVQSLAVPDIEPTLGHYDVPSSHRARNKKEARSCLSGCYRRSQSQSVSYLPTIRQEQVDVIVIKAPSHQQRPTRSFHSVVVRGRGGVSSCEEGTATCETPAARGQTRR